ncbi:hypothetical protein [Fodinibius halophilus]|uniref:Uncharacterized protein n=1 Tax=Fodinibius halophilus TaxID=1736908 RepID=A0A6M1T677_9BACT|nr:hypothetical protein [Fodinibius halophilus]NGP87511.1 hypothetical protein [Fodinibius halophilus]
MSTLLNVLSIQWRELKQARSFYTALALGIPLFIYTGIFMDLQWNAYQLVAVDYITTSEPNLFISQWAFGYFVILFCLCYTSGAILMLNKTGEFTSLLFSKPISREKFFLYLISGTTLLIMIPFVLLHLSFWINFGILDQVWSPYIWLSLLGLLAPCLLIVSSISFFSFISGSGVFPTIVYCFIFPFIFGEKEKFLYPLADNNIYRGLIDFIDLFLPNFGDLLMFSGNIFAQQPYQLSINTLGIPYIVILLGISFFLFKRKNI